MDLLRNTCGIEKRCRFARLHGLGCIEGEGCCACGASDSEGIESNLGCKVLKSDFCLLEEGAGGADLMKGIAQRKIRGVRRYQRWFLRF